MEIIVGDYQKLKMNLLYGLAIALSGVFPKDWAS